MKKIIDGKVYNTKTATHLCGWSNDAPFRDFNYCDEDLYLSPKGAYFLAGEGGALSEYSTEHAGGGRSGGESMRLLSKAEALQWCEERDIDPDKIAEIFVDLGEG